MEWQSQVMMVTEGGEGKVYMAKLEDSLPSVLKAQLVYHQIILIR